MQGFLQSWGYVAIIVFGVLEACCIPISSELTFLLGGALASSGFSATHHLNLALVIILGTLAELVGSYISYSVGKVGGRPLVRRWGRYVLVTESDINRAERFLVGRGAWAVPVARMLPLVRAFASIVSGIVDIPPLRFGILNLAGTVVYVAALSGAGYSLGHAYAKVGKDLTDVSYLLVVLVVLAIVAFVLIRLREFRKEAAESAAAGRPGDVRPGDARATGAADETRIDGFPAVGSDGRVPDGGVPDDRRPARRNL
jgi:membrane protein DedA with SNARE-associated domain